MSGIRTLPAVMDVYMRSPFILAAVLSVVLAACGGETNADGTGGAGAGGGPASGGQAAGGQAGGGGPGSGGAGAESSGGASSGGSSTGGERATGGDGSGGSNDGSGGAAPGCDCDSVSVPVCGSDGQTYDAGCGEECVPVPIECQGECPCPPPIECDCEVEGYDGCNDDSHVRWLCAGSNHSGQMALEEGCEILPTGLERYCCPPSVTASVFCPQ